MDPVVIICEMLLELEYKANQPMDRFERMELETKIKVLREVLARIGMERAAGSHPSELGGGL